MLRYQVAKNFVEQSREKDGEVIINDNSYVVRQSCLDMVDDVYCHHYFKRCYISSRPPLICRETCEELFFKVCDREYKIVKEFMNSTQREAVRYPYFFDIIDCTTLPFRNESSNCYYPDKIRGQWGWGGGGWYWTGSTVVCHILCARDYGEEKPYNPLSIKCPIGLHALPRGGRYICYKHRVLQFSCSPHVKFYPKLDAREKHPQVSHNVVWFAILGPVVQSVDNSIHWTNRYPLDSDLSGG